MSSQEFVLTSVHMSILRRYIPKFRTANPTSREKMVEEAADNIRSTWTEDAEFDRAAAISVCKLSAKLGYSQIFLVSSVFACICTAKLNDLRNLHLRPENGRTVRFMLPCTE
jgi:hypothetical protein